MEPDGAAMARPRSFGYPAFLRTSSASRRFETVTLDACSLQRTSTRHSRKLPFSAPCPSHERLLLRQRLGFVVARNLAYQGLAGLDRQWSGTFRDGFSL